MKIFIKLIPIITCALLATGCGATNLNSSEDKPSSTHTKVSAPETTVIYPSADELATIKAEASAKAPNISYDAQEKGIAEGNIYVIYAPVMCFGGTLDTPEDFKKTSHSEEEIAEFENTYNLIPQKVLDQDQLNKENRFSVSQECYDAGWVNPGPV